MLKADFHIHTKEDPYDRHFLSYNAKDMIKFAAEKGFEVLSITNHSSVYFNKAIKDYAKKKGILLIPGAEARIEGRDVLLINVTNKDLNKLKRLDDLKKLKESALIIAPHPFFFRAICLGKRLEKHIDSFHAIEYCHFFTRILLHPWFRFLNPNTLAIKIAKKYKKPLVGTSDAHHLFDMNRTYTLVDSAKNKNDFIDAIKKNRIKLVSNPMPTLLFFRTMAGLHLKGVVSGILHPRKSMPFYFQKFFKRFK